MNSDDICTWCENESVVILRNRDNRLDLAIDRIPVCSDHLPIVEGILYGREEVRNYYIPTGAGYDNHGNDRHGHMHIHPKGTLISSHGKRGFYCAAPVHHGICLDPIPFHER